ncbi:hypothetical protein GUITHDRAFT_156431 [Guillardia theta CCMP2712]|uniref:Uncharacterized protein n=1 Tax=Guillardia theta (strain CCMP2712) TaxID=905079 RepID=L1I835_GUITC|nr:hypothetical protein GUITHDRAFT_156431 [Guillardia theta CCMP2712]EKX32020.1 hypothetical protein GUITHDRAFT_156431 [Guillardia theta CCMP2712]|eukprot:XP_005819000.1 hypothetical protein GUITHDRAFT_156431 [Guillardia theta CCMP2712]
MDRMLAPFVRISHNIKGKGKIGGPSLTDDELALIRKYTTFLSEPDLYPRIEANGSSLEDFLEALFLMGIAGGVGMDESAAKQSGFSKKSQIILAQALDNFNADELRSCYTEWRELHVRLEGIRKDKRFSEKDARVQKSSAMWLEAAKELDRICKEWQRVAPTHIRCLENFGKFQKSIAQKCQEEFGIAVELQLPEEVAVEYEDDVKGR